MYFSLLEYHYCVSLVKLNLKSVSLLVSSVSASSHTMLTRQCILACRSPLIFTYEDIGMDLVPYHSTHTPNRANKCMGRFLFPQIEDDNLDSVLVKNKRIIMIMANGFWIMILSAKDHCTPNDSLCNIGQSLLNFV